MALTNKGAAWYAIIKGIQGWMIDLIVGRLILELIGSGCAVGSQRSQLTQPYIPNHTGN